MLNFSVELAVDCLKTICNNTQCVTCDKLRGPCVRFPCGHLICMNCAETAGECMFCLSSQTGPYLVDKPQTSRVNNVSALLTAFQETFKIDVKKRARVSDQLKVEKQVFPKCIQAPQKYCNKKKSLNFSQKYIENINPSFFPGEHICSETGNMKRSFQYVQDWINQHDNIPQKQPRKPFGDINVNTLSFIPKAQKRVIKLNKVITQTNAKQSNPEKTSHIKSCHNSSSFLNNLDEQNLRNINQPRLVEIDNETINCNNHMIRKYEKDESGIVLDDEQILIEDTATEIVDKDKLAWLAVLAVAEKEEHEGKETSSESKFLTNEKGHSLVDSNVKAEITGNINTCQKNQENILKKVCFYKKSFLFETCKRCNTCVQEERNKDVSIVINNSDFTTTINITQCAEKNIEKCNKTSVAIQTDKSTTVSECGDDGNITPQKRKFLSTGNEKPAKRLATQNLDVFTSHKTKECSNLESNNLKKDLLNVCNNSVNQPRCLVIDESDSDSDISITNTHEVVAEVHRASTPETVDCGILATLSKRDYQHRSKRPLRGQTPNSTDSSDKENFDPNRKKGARCEKKRKKKI